MNGKKKQRSNGNARTRQRQHWGTSQPTFYEIERTTGRAPAFAIEAAAGHTPWFTSAILEISDSPDILVTMDQDGLLRNKERGGKLPLGLKVMAAAVQARDGYKAVVEQGVTTHDGLVAALSAMQQLNCMHEALQEFRPHARLEQAQIFLRHGELAAKAHAASLAHPEWDLAKLIAKGEMALNEAACNSLMVTLMELTKLGLTGTADYSAAHALLGELADELPADFSAKKIGVKLRDGRPGDTSTKGPPANASHGPITPGSAAPARERGPRPTPPGNKPERVSKAAGAPQPAAAPSPGAAADGFRWRLRRPAGADHYLSTEEVETIRLAGGVDWLSAPEGDAAGWLASVASAIGLTEDCAYRAVKHAAVERLERSFPEYENRKEWWSCASGKQAGLPWDAGLRAVARAVDELLLPMDDGLQERDRPQELARLYNIQAAAMEGLLVMAERFDWDGRRWPDRAEFLGRGLIGAFAARRIIIDGGGDTSDANEEMRDANSRIVRLAEAFGDGVMGALALRRPGQGPCPARSLLAVADTIERPEFSGYPEARFVVSAASRLR